MPSTSSTRRIRIVVMGYIVRGPVAGMAWHHLQYVLGLMRLGHEVYFLEDSGEGVLCYDPSRDVRDTDPSYGLRFTTECFDRLGMPQNWAFFDATCDTWRGPLADSMTRVCSSADLLIDLSPMDPIRDWVAQIPTRVLIDTDPLFNQIDHLQHPENRERAATFTHYFSFGENIGRADCTIPDDGFPWKPTRQPVVLTAWPVTPGNVDSDFSTVMLWDSYAVRVFGGSKFGMKSQSFPAYLDLPARVGARLNLALGGGTAPKRMLEDHGWKLTDPLSVSLNLDTYGDFIRCSAGEFSVAKQGYVSTRSGWFSERSAAYLASARPVIVEDTGFSTHVATSSGLIGFRNLDEAAAAIEEVRRRYKYHCSAAREVAQEFFDSARVLNSLLERAGGNS